MEANYHFIAVGSGIGVLVVAFVLIWVSGWQRRTPTSEPAGRQQTALLRVTQVLPQCQMEALKQFDGLTGVAGWLVALGGSKPHVTYLLNRSGDTMIGTGQNCKIVLPDRFVSSVHCKIVGRSGYFTIEQLPGATNPTKVNGQVLQRPVTLHDGSELLIGDTRMVFKSVGPLESES